MQIKKLLQDDFAPGARLRALFASSFASVVNQFDGDEREKFITDLAEATGQPIDRLNSLAALDGGLCTSMEFAAIAEALGLEIELRLNDPVTGTIYVSAGFANVGKTEVA